MQLACLRVRMFVFVMLSSGRQCPQRGMVTQFDILSSFVDRFSCGFGCLIKNEMAEI